MPTYSVHTAKSQDYQGSVPSQRQYGYVIRITPPIVMIQHGEDIEGIGMVAVSPTTTTCTAFCWMVSLQSRRITEIGRTHQS